MLTKYFKGLNYPYLRGLLFAEKVICT